MDVAVLAAKLDELTARFEQRERELIAERDEYKRLYNQALERIRRLELGLLGQKAERVPAQGAQLDLLLGAVFDDEHSYEPVTEDVRSHTRRKPTGRKPIPDNLPRVELELIPDEVKRKGLDAFEVIGTEVREVIERRPSSMVVLRTIRPSFVEKATRAQAKTVVHIAPPLELPIPRGLAGPGLLADTVPVPGIVITWRSERSDAGLGLVTRRGCFLPCGVMDRRASAGGRC